MAEKLIKTRLKLKYDTFANWDKVKTTFVPLKGEVCLVEVPDAVDPIRNAPAILSKVGDGATAFGDLKYASALAADVYSWAKASGITVSNSGTGDFVKSIAWTDNKLVITKDNVPTPAAPGNGKLTITVGDDATVFTANQATGSDVAITLGTAATKAETYFDKAGAAAQALKDAKDYADGKSHHNQTVKAKDSSAADVTFDADAAVEIKAGGNVTITPNATDNTITVAVPDANINGLIDQKINALDVADSAVANKYVTAVSEANGKITVSRKQISYTELADKPTIPTMPTVGNGALTIKVGENGDVSGTGSFTANQGSASTITLPVYTKTEVDARITGAVQYLGTVASATELAALNPDSAGDFCRVSTAFDSYHAGDLLLCKTIKSGATAATWDVIHGEIDKNTWTANTKDADGYVTKGSGQANKVWKTDTNGVPAWREDADTQYDDATQSVHGLMSAADKTKLDGIATGATRVTKDTVTSWGFKTTDTTYDIATATVPGLVKSSTTGTTTGRNYNVQVNADGTMKVNVPWTDTQVTSAANHYTPAADTSAALSASASSTTAATWNSTSLVTGVNLQRDAKGHVVGVSVNSIKMPANPNVTTTVSTTANGGLKVAKTNNDYKVDIDDAIIFVLDCGSSTTQI